MLRYSEASVLVVFVLLGCAARPEDRTRDAGVATTQKVATSPATQKIAEFQGPYRFLSNFYPATVEFEGITYPTVEHAYQSAKTLDINERKRIAALSTPSVAKSEGRKLALRSDWETAKFEVMERCVRYKFTHNPELGRKLLETGNALLEEGNTWGDRVWGVYQGQGENRLGKILMKVREELNPQPPETRRPH
jgi:N-glycosidase YbiA